MGIKFGSVAFERVESRVNLDRVRCLSLIFSQASLPSYMFLGPRRRRTIRVNSISCFLTNSLESLEIQSTLVYNEK